MTQVPQQEDVYPRRTFLQRLSWLSAAAVISISCPQVVRATAEAKEPRSLSFFHTHTHETLDIIYFDGREYEQQALNAIDEYLRDFRTGEVFPMDPQLLDTLWQLQQTLGREGVYEVISGFRSPKTNTLLRKKGAGVAKRSLHMQGRAIDVRVTGTDTCAVRDCAIGMRCGGVGYYGKSDFVHLDTGRVRTW